MRLLSVLAIIVAFFGFCIYAHHNISTKQENSARVELAELQEQHASVTRNMRTRIKALQHEARERRETLLVMFPDEDDQNRIKSLFDGSEEETESETVETNDFEELLEAEQSTEEGSEG